MFAVAMMALLAVAPQAQEGTEDLDNQEIEIVLNKEDSESEELVFNDDGECSDQVILEEEETDVSDELASSEDEE